MECVELAPAVREVRRLESGSKLHALHTHREVRWPLCTPAVILGPVTFLLTGQLNRKPAPMSRLAADHHASAVRFDNMFHDAQADAHTLRLAPKFAAAPIKSLKNLPLFFRRNTVAMILDPDSEEGRGLRVEARIPRLTRPSTLDPRPSQPDRHRPVPRRMFDGIVYQVHQRLL